MKEKLEIDYDERYFDIYAGNLYLNYPGCYTKEINIEITKEKAKEIIYFLTKFVEGE